MSKSNEMTISDGSPDPFAAAAAEAASNAPFLKFTKGKYYLLEVEVPPGTEFTVSKNDIAWGLVMFFGGKKLNEKIGRIADGFKLPEREELGDLDPAHWETDSAGKPKDPWTKQFYAPMVNVESGEPAIFVTGSKGGAAAVGGLLAQIARNPLRGNPTIALHVREYKHPQHGRLTNPVLKVIGWEMDRPTIAREMNDVIPF
jgi:hypothetical protein